MGTVIDNACIHPPKPGGCEPTAPEGCSRDHPRSAAEQDTDVKRPHVLTVAVAIHTRADHCVVRSKPHSYLIPLAGLTRLADYSQAKPSLVAVESETVTGV